VNAIMQIDEQKPENSFSMQLYYLVPDRKSYFLKKSAKNLKNYFWNFFSEPEKLLIFW
jgi:hypothetical protein